MDPIQRNAMHCNEKPAFLNVTGPELRQSIEIPIDVTTEFGRVQLLCPSPKHLRIVGPDMFSRNGSEIRNHSLSPAIEIELKCTSDGVVVGFNPLSENNNPSIRSPFDQSHIPQVEWNRSDIKY
jgi:hypothetical protein